MIYIGIDPDVDKNGFAVWDANDKSLNYIGVCRFFGLINEIESLIATGEDVIVFIEAGWLIRKSNFHSKKGQTKSVGEKIAKAVGANHQVGKLLAEYCDDKKIAYALIRPQGKKKADEFKRITGYQKRTNSEMRDAAMLVFGR